MVYLTKRQKGVYDFLKEFIEEKGYAPSVKELCEHFGKASLNTMHKHILTLENKGLIRRDAKKSRSVELVEEHLKKKDAFEVPVLGYITDGAPIQPTESINFIKVPNLLLKDNNVFILIVKGNYLSSEYIKDNDNILIESRKYAENGDLAVIRTEGENIIVRKIFKKENYFMLQSPLLGVEPLVKKEEELNILGVIKGVYRNY
jgi:repressor LexA